jgi:hypothetical protein
MRWARHVEYMGEVRDACRVVTRKSVDVDGMIILKCNLKKYGVRM